MNKTIAAVIAAAMLLTLSACSQSSAPAVASTPTKAASEAAQPLLETPAPPAENEIALYAKLGSNPPMPMENVPCKNNSYTVDTDYAALMERWGISSKRYVCIGWFFMDENDQAMHWAGTGAIQFTKPGDKRLMAVFNTYTTQTSRFEGGSLHLYQRIDGDLPTLKNIIPGIHRYLLSQSPDGLLGNMPPDPQQYTFTGWYQKDGDGNFSLPLPARALKLQNDEIIEICAVYVGKS